MSDPNNKRRAALYGRVSTEMQAGEDHFSIEAQLAEMHEYCERKGYQVVGEFVDRGISGSQRSRPQLDNLMALANNRQFDVLIVHDLSRLSRTVYHTLDILQDLGKWGVSFASVKDPDFDFTDPAKQFFLIILAAMNQYFLTQLRLHTAKSKNQRARVGLYNASVPPYGYARGEDPRQPFTINEEEARAVRFIYEQYATGRYSHQQIADLLAAAGFRPRPSPRRRGETPTVRQQFSKETVTDILKNPFYTGRVGYRIKHGKAKEIYEGRHEPLISLDLWERAQQAAQNRQQASRSAQAVYRPYLLSNLAYCDVCHRKLRSQHATGGGSYYRETSYQRGFADCPNQKSGVRTELVDRQIHAIVEMIELPADWQAEIGEQLVDTAEIENIERQRTRLQAEMRRMREMYRRGEYDDDVDEFHNIMKGLRRQLDQLPAERPDDSLYAVMQSIQSLRDIWADASADDQRDLFRLMFQEVVVDVANARVVSLKPDPVMLPILRQVPLLRESDWGVFVPAWPPELAAQVLSVPYHPPLATLPEQTAALPFIAASPFQPSVTGARIAPQISQALERCESVNPQGWRVVQVTHPGAAPLPADLRKWPGARSELISPAQFAGLAPGSVDVLVTQYLFWDAALSDQPAALAEQIARVHQVLAPGGVWLIQEPLPANSQSHWIYLALPRLADWVQGRFVDAAALYRALQTAEFEIGFDYAAAYQPITAALARTLIADRAGLLARAPLDDTADLAARLPADPAAIIPSEYTFCTVWCCKAKSA